MINKLSKEFAEKSEADRKSLFRDMLLAPIMHMDCTNAKVNGKSAYVFICVTLDGKALYFAHEKKVHEGVKETVVEEYQGILVHNQLTLVSCGYNLYKYHNKKKRQLEAA